jgi:hypothetical protein
MDPDAPLINREHPATFYRKTNGRSELGRVFCQYQDQHRKHLNHANAFYVEFPEGSYHEISAPRLAAILGDGAQSRSFSRIEVARTLERMVPAMDLVRLLPNLKP